VSGFTFEVDVEGVKTLMRGNDVKAFIDERAQAALEIARATAPVETGMYRDSLNVTPATETADGNVSASLYSDSWYWHMVEFGTAHNPAHHVLEMAITSAGLEFHPE